MSTRPCLIAAVDLSPSAEGIIRRAAHLAALCQAHLTLFHAVDFHAGYETDHVPFRTPDEVRTQMRRRARAWLLGLACCLDVREVEILVRAGRVRDELIGFATERQARYILTGISRWGPLSPLAGLARDPRLVALGCDLLSTGSEGSRWERVMSDWLGRWLPKRV